MAGHGGKAQTDLLAPGAAGIDQAVAALRRELVRANMIWLLREAQLLFPGNSWLALRGALDRDSVQLRQVAIYLAHTGGGIDAAHVAAVFGQHRSQAVRAVQHVETRRGDDRFFDHRIQQLEDRLARALAAMSYARPPNGPPTPRGEACAAAGDEPAAVAGLTVAV